MVLYFSGTGNSEYVAKRIGQGISEEVMNLFEKIQKDDVSEIRSDSPWVVVAPTYAWRIPRIVQNWLEKAALAGSREIYFVMTCGGNIGSAGKYLEKLCAAKKMRCLGCCGILMPENYIAMFSTPDQDEALKIIQQAEGAIDEAILKIKSGEPFPEVRATLTDRLSSGIVNDLFYPMCVRTKKFYVTDACISCGKCVKVCPLNNIRLDNGKPQWGKRCTHCMACICRCPKEAIEYGNHSKGRPRYICPRHM